jgi:hypothetical protein
MLTVYAARISSRDPDRLDITRKSGGPNGLPFAPSWNILRPVLAARSAEDEALSEVSRAIAVAAHDEAWDRYVTAYLAEMPRPTSRIDLRGMRCLLGSGSCSSATAPTRITATASCSPRRSCASSEPTSEVRHADLPHHRLDLRRHRRRWRAKSRLADVELC